MAEQVGAINVIISANPEALKKGLQSASKSLEEFGKRAEKLGKDISMKVTAPITALGVASVAAFATQEKAEMRLRAALAANGRQVESLFKDYATFASELQKITVVGDEATLAMLQQAESLGLTGDAAKNAVKNAIAMQAAFNVNAESALRYTAALAQGDATMLTRYIPALKQTTNAAERVAIAQDVLAKAFAAAEGEANSFSGQLQQTKNTIGDLMEQFGAIVSESIEPLIKRIKELTEQFQQLDQSTKQTIVVIGGLVAAVGPALIIIGKISIGLAALPGLFAALSGPIGLAIVAVGALTAALFKFRDISRGGEESLKMIADATDVVTGAYDKLHSAQSDINDILKDSTKYSKEQAAAKKAEAQATLMTADAALKEAKAKRQVIIEQLKEEMQRSQKIGFLGGGLGILQMGFQKGKFDEVGAELSKLLQIEKGAEAQSKALAEALYNLENATLEYGNGLENTNQKCKENTTLMDSQAEAARLLAEENIKLAESVQDDIARRTTEGFEFQLGLKTGDFERFTPEDFTEDWTDFDIPEMPIEIPGSKEMAENFKNRQEMMAEVAKQSAQAIAQAFSTMGGQLFGDLQNSSNAFQRFAGSIGAGVTEIIGMLLANAISNAILGGTQAGVATGPAAPFTTPAFIATAVGSVMAAFGSIPAFAQGGMVTGPTLAMVGDNASGKEAIIPFEKMGAFMNMMGGSNVNVNITGEFDGDALRLVLDKSSKDLNNLR